MKGFFLGFATASLLFAAYIAWDAYRRPAVVAPSIAPDAGVAPMAKKKRKRAAGDERPVVQLSAADLRSVGEGEDLSRPDVVRMDLGERGETRELEQDEIDAPFRAEEPAMLDCISRSRPDPETDVPGRVTVKFRIQRTGAVRGVRVEAPAILQKGGLYACLKGIVSRLRFPASSRSQIVSYPFALH